MTKQCTKCNQIKELDSFGIVKRSPNKRKSWCTICAGLASTKWQKNHKEQNNATRRTRLKANPEKEQSSRLVRRYGITLDQKKKMLDNQGYKCPLCQRHENVLARSLMVDHCHTTGKVRELLCFNCNSALGHLKEDIETAKRLVEYIIKHKELTNG